MTVRTAVRIINLESAGARREAFTRDAKDAGIEWEFFRGHAELVPPLSYDQHAAVRRFGRPLSAGEIGCYTSHYKLWQWLAASDYDQALIFEDDMFIDWPAIRELAQYDFAQRRYHLVRLHLPGPFKGEPIAYPFLSLRSGLYRGTGLVLGTAAYLLTREGATTLLKNNERILFPCDWILARYGEHRLWPYILFPFPVYEKYGPSSIGIDRARTPHYTTLTDKIIRFCWRVRDWARREVIEQLSVTK